MNPKPNHIMNSRKGLFSILILLMLTATPIATLTGISPAGGTPDRIVFPAETRDLVDGALIYLANHPKRMEELDASPAPEGFINVIAQVDDLQPQHITFVEKLGGTVFDSWERFDALAATIPLAALPELTYLPGLTWLEPSLTYHILLDESVPAIGGDQVWTRYGFRGEGTTIAIVDTGIDAQHESLDDLDDDPETDDPKVIGFYDARSGQRGEKDPIDAHGHGSHVSGIAAGTGGPDATYVGMAPQAYLVGVLVGDGGGIAMADLLDGIDWVITNKDRFSIDVMSMSLGGVLVVPGATNDGSSAASQAADDAVEAGIVTTIAVGNGNLQVAAHAGSVSAPADSRRAITVGSVNNNGNRAISSSRGPTGDGRIKPDVMAPGVGINSVDRNTGNGYTSMTGTSMACPHVAGLAALMLQANPGLAPNVTVEYIKQIMHETSRHEWGEQPDPAEPFSPNNQYGWGTVDSIGAVRRSLDLWTGQIIARDGDLTMQAMGSEGYSLSFTYTKSEYTYQGKNGDSHNPPLGQDAPDSIYIKAHLPSSWPEPTNIAGDPMASGGLIATVEPDPLVAEEIDGEWVIGAWFNYTGDVSERELVVSTPTLEFMVNAPAYADQATLLGEYFLNDIPGETAEEPITVVSDPPDIIVGIEANVTLPTDGDLVNFTMTVKNIGEGYALTGTLMLIRSSEDPVSNEPLVEWTLPTIAPDISLTRNYEWNSSGYPGVHTFTAPVNDVVPDETDSQNNDDELSLRVKEKEQPPENTPPTVEFINPLHGEILQGIVSVEGSADDIDEEDVLTVEAKVIPGEWTDADGGESWSWEWDTTQEANGEYTLQARAFDGEDYSEIFEITVTVDNEGENVRPTASIDASTLEILAGETVDFDGSGSDDDSSVDSYLFDFGDGEDSGWQSSDRASHSYGYEGNFTVNLVVEDDDGAQSTNTAEVTITVREPKEDENRAPTAVISNPREDSVANEGVPRLLDGRDSSDPDRDDLTYVWESDVQGLLGNESKFYAVFEPGNHTVTLTVDDGHGGTHTAVVHITILPTEQPEDKGGSNDDSFLPGFGIVQVLVGIMVSVILIGVFGRRN